MTGTKKVYHLVNVLDEKGKAIDFKSSSEYHNSVPSGAARKAFSAVCRHKNLKGECGMTVNVKQKNKDKQYSYSVYRSKLQTPKELLGRVIEYEVSCKANKHLILTNSEPEPTKKTAPAKKEKAPKKAPAKKEKAPKKAPAKKAKKSN